MLSIVIMQVSITKFRFNTRKTLNIPGDGGLPAVFSDKELFPAKSLDKKNHLW
jgi:hypothetical protein